MDCIKIFIIKFTSAETGKPIAVYLSPGDNAKEAYYSAKERFYADGRPGDMATLVSIEQTNKFLPIRIL